MNLNRFFTGEQGERRSAGFLKLLRLRLLLFLASEGGKQRQSFPISQAKYVRTTK